MSKNTIKVVFTTYKESGKHMETRSYDFKNVEPFQTNVILEKFYKKHPKLKKMNFTFEVWSDGMFNSRLILNQPKT